MVRGRHGGSILLLMIVAITALAVVALADDGEASWSGEPLPSWGSPWYITQDTVYTDETIRLNGRIYVESPNTLSLDGCTLIFGHLAVFIGHWFTRSGCHRSCDFSR